MFGVELIGDENFVFILVNVILFVSCFKIFVLLFNILVIAGDGRVRKKGVRSLSWNLKKRKGFAIKI